MVKPFPSKTHIGNHMLHPETLMLNCGYGGKMPPQIAAGVVSHTFHWFANRPGPQK